MSVEQLLEQALQLPSDERQRLAGTLWESVPQTALAEDLLAERDIDADAEAFAGLTDEALEQLIRNEPLSPAEIVARGLTGGWSRLEIEDGAEWVNEQKRQRREPNQWSVTSWIRRR